MPGQQTGMEQVHRTAVLLKRGASSRCLVHRMVVIISPSGARRSTVLAMHRMVVQGPAPALEIVAGVASSTGLAHRMTVQKRQARGQNAARRSKKPGSDRLSRVGSVRHLRVRSEPRSQAQDLLSLASLAAYPRHLRPR